MSPQNEPLKPKALSRSLVVPSWPLTSEQAHRNQGEKGPGLACLRGGGRSLSGGLGSIQALLRLQSQLRRRPAHLMPFSAVSSSRPSLPRSSRAETSQPCLGESSFRKSRTCKPQTRCTSGRYEALLPLFDSGAEDPLQREREGTKKRTSSLKESDRLGRVQTSPQRGFEPARGPSRFPPGRPARSTGVFVPAA